MITALVLLSLVVLCVAGVALDGLLQPPLEFPSYRDRELECMSKLQRLEQEVGYDEHH